MAIYYKNEFGLVVLEALNLIKTVDVEEVAAADLQK